MTPVLSILRLAPDGKTVERTTLPMTELPWATRFATASGELIVLEVREIPEKATPEDAR